MCMNTSRNVQLIIQRLQLLKNLHTKVPNEVFVRHALATAIRVNPTRVPAFSSKAR